MPTLHIFRGLPGSGKTSEANKLGCLVVSPWDMFCTVDGEYCFAERSGEPDAKRRKTEWALRIIEATLRERCDVAVAEVLPRKIDVEPYCKLARQTQSKLVVKDLIVDVETSLARNVHNVPEHVIRSMADNFEPWEDEGVK